MTVRHGRKAIAAVLVTSVVATSIVMSGGAVVHADAPVLVAPERIYGPINAPVPFTGDDPIGGNRKITISGVTADTCENGPPDYDANGNQCARVFIDFIDGSEHGTLYLPGVTKEQDQVPNDVFVAPGGAIITQHDASNPDLAANPRSDFLNIVGTGPQLQAALDVLVWEPENDYEYLNSSYNVTMRMDARQGDGSSDSVITYTDIRILGVNDWPDLTVPSGPIAVTAGPTGVTSEANDPTPDYMLEPEADDELNAPQADFWVHDPDLHRRDLEDVMLVAMLADCGEFHLRDASLEVSNDIENLLTTALSLGTLDEATRDLVIEAIMAVIPPEVANAQFATTPSDEFTDALLGVGDLNEVNYALSEVTFRDLNDDETCTLTTFVTDLGGNGMPFSYIADPGIEIPIPGFDIGQTVYQVAPLEDIDISFDAEPLFYPEANAPDPAEVELHISPATHPEFTVKWDAVPRVTDPPPGPGVATPNDDFAGTFNNTLTIPENATTVTISTNVFPDFSNEAEGNETFEYLLVLSEPAPPGYNIVSSTPSRTVVIVDDDDAAPMLTSVSNPTVSEGDAGTTNMTFTLTLDGPADGNETVDVDAVDGTAELSDSDYVALSDTVTFAPGATTATVTVLVNGDTDDEPNETLTLQLSNASNVTLGDSSGTGTITNDDATRSVVSVSAPSTLEGNPPNTPTMLFTITLDNPAKAGDSVRVNTSGATPGVDYTAITNLVVPFTAGSTTAVVPVTITGDTVIEGDEVITLTLDQPSPGVSIASVSSGTGTILNDDGVPTVTIDDVTVTEGDAGSTLATFTLSLSDPAIGGEQITVSALDGSAIGGSDFFDNSQTITFAPSHTTQTFTVAVIGDTEAEPDETFDVVLTNPVGLLVGDGGAPGVGTIINDDITVSITPTLTIPEGGSDTATLTITPATHPVLSVMVTTAPGTASAGDFVGLPGTIVVVPADASTVPILLTTNEDLIFEADEAFTVTVAPVGSPPGFTVRTPAPGDTSTVTITDDDPQPTVSLADLIVAEGDVAAVPLTSTNPEHDCVVNYATTEGSALDPEDFTGIAGQLTMGPATTLDVNTFDDTDVEGAETFTVAITLEPGGDPACQIGTSTATVTIVDDDDPAPTLSITDAGVTEGTGAGTTTLSFTVTTSGVQPADCTFDVALAHVTTSDADLTAPGDFPATLAFTTTDLELQIDVGIVRDAIDEADETFTLTLTGSGGTPCAIGASGMATGTIVDDDDPPVDNDPPTVTVTSAGPNPTSSTTIPFTVQFSEAVTGFVAGDVTLGGTANPTNASVTMVDADTYTVNVTGMSGSGTVTLFVAAGVAQDLAGNDNMASNTATVDYEEQLVDDEPPGVTVTAASPSPTSSSPVQFSVVFDEPVTGFATGDVTLGGTAGATTATVVASDGTGMNYTVAVTGMTATGSVTVSVAAGVAQDLAGNPNLASNTATVQYVVAPGALTLDLPSDITRNNDPGQPGAVVAFTATASGGVPPVVVVCDPASGAFFAIGATTVTCIATDGEEGQQDEAIVSGTFTVTVVDVEPPTIADLPDLTRTTTDTTPVAVLFPLPAASDNSGAPPTVSCSPGSGTAFPVGVTTVTCTATDGAGLTATSSFTVTVTSTPAQPPAPTTPGGGLPATGSSSTTHMLMLATLLVGVGLALRGGRRRWM